MLKQESAALVENASVTGVKSEEPVNPWLGIWLQPRQAIQTVVTKNPDYGVKPIPIFLTILQLSPAVFPLEIGPLYYRLLFVLIAGLVGGLLGLYYIGWIYALVGNWFGGQSESTGTRAAFAWAQMPNLFAAMLIAASFFLVQYGFLPKIQGTFVQAVLGLPFAIWSLVLICHTLGEVHGFSAWRGFFTVLVGSIVSAVPIMILGMVLAIALPVAINQVKIPQLKNYTENAQVKAALSQLQHLAPSKLTSGAQIAIPKQLPIAPTLNLKRGIHGVSDEDLDAMRYAATQVEIRLASDDVITGTVLDVSSDSIYLDVDGMARNIRKKDIASLVKKVQGEAAIVKAEAADSLKENVERVTGEAETATKANTQT